MCGSVFHHLRAVTSPIQRLEHTTQADQSQLKLSLRDAISLTRIFVHIHKLDRPYSRNWACLSRVLQSAAVDLSFSAQTHRSVKEKAVWVLHMILIKLHLGCLKSWISSSLVYSAAALFSLRKPKFRGTNSAACWHRAGGGYRYVCLITKAPWFCIWLHTSDSESSF